MYKKRTKKNNIFFLSIKYENGSFFTVALHVKSLPKLHVRFRIFSDMIENVADSLTQKRRVKKVYSFFCVQMLFQ